MKTRRKMSMKIKFNKIFVHLKNYWQLMNKIQFFIWKIKSQKIRKKKKRKMKERLLIRCKRLRGLYLLLRLQMCWRRKKSLNPKYYRVLMRHFKMKKLKIKLKIMRKKKREKKMKKRKRKMKFKLLKAITSKLLTPISQNQVHQKMAVVHNRQNQLL